VASTVNIREQTLPNGLLLLMLEDHSAPVVTVQVWYRVGSRNEHVGIRGLAHLLEHMMFKGSTNVGPEEHARIIDAIGGRENAFTSEDATAYFDTVPSDWLSLALELEAERMQHARLDSTHFFKEREVVKEEIRRSQQNNPVGALLDRFRQVAFKIHPYNWTPGGTLADLDRISLPDLQAFYRTYYVPNNAVLIVVGDTTVAQVQKLAQQHFGSIPRQPDPPVVDVVEPNQTEYRHEVLRFPTQLPFLIGGYKVPEAAHQDSKVLEVISNLLCSGKSSRLHQVLVRQLQLAIFAGAWNSKQLDPGLFVVLAGFTPDKSPDQVEAALLTEIERLSGGELSKDELEKVKTQLLSEYIFKLTSIEQQGFEIGSAECIEKSYHRFLEGADQYQQVNQQDVRRVTVQYLNRNRLTTALLLSPESDEDIRKEAATRVEEAERETASWPTAERLLQPGGPSGAPIELPRVDTAVLSNALKLQVVERHEQPVVHFNLIGVGGEVAVPPGKAGLTSLLTEMLTQGTRTRTADQIAAEVDALGGSLSAWKDDEYIRLQGRFLKRDLAKGLELFSDVALQPTFPADELEKTRPQVEGGIRMKRDQPYSLAVEHLRYMVYGYQDPRGRPASLETAHNVAAEDLARVYRQTVQPQGALLSIVGDITHDEIADLVGEAFATWSTTAAVPKLMPDPTYRRGRAIRLIDKPDLTQATLVVGHLGINRTDPDYLPLILGNYALGGGGFSSRLMKNLRSKSGKTYGVGSSFVTGRKRGLFIAQTFTRSSETAATLEMLIAEIDSVRNQGISASELLAAKNNLAGSYTLRLQPPEGVAQELLMADFYGLPKDWVRCYRQRVVAPSLEEVNAALKRHLRPQDLTLVVVGKADEIGKQLQSFGAVTKISYLEAVPDEERAIK
jgi:zinc protease